MLAPLDLVWCSWLGCRAHFGNFYSDSQRKVIGPNGCPFVVVALRGTVCALHTMQGSTCPPTRLKLFDAPPVSMCLHLHRDSHSWPIFCFIDFPFSPSKRNVSGAFFDLVTPDLDKTNEKTMFLSLLFFNPLFGSAVVTLRAPATACTTSGALFVPSTPCRGATSPNPAQAFCCTSGFNVPSFTS